MNNTYGAPSKMAYHGYINYYKCLPDPGGYCEWFVYCSMGCTFSWYYQCTGETDFDTYYTAY